jgi:hypothetical protein
MATTFSAGQNRLGVALLVTNEGGTAMNVCDKGRLSNEFCTYTDTRIHLTGPYGFYRTLYDLIIG